MVSNSINSDDNLGAGKPNDELNRSGMRLPSRSEIAQRLSPLIEFFRGISPGEPITIVLGDRTVEGRFLALDEKLLRISINQIGRSVDSSIDLIDMGHAARLQPDSPHFYDLYDQHRIENSALRQMIERNSDQPQLEVELRTGVKICGKVSFPEDSPSIIVKVSGQRAKRIKPRDVVSIRPLAPDHGESNHSILPESCSAPAHTEQAPNDLDPLDDINISFSNEDPSPISKREVSYPKLPADPSSRHCFWHPGQLVGVQTIGIETTYLKGPPMTRRAITEALVGERVLGEVRIDLRNGYSVSGVLLNDIIQGTGWLINIDGEFSLHFSYDDVHAVHVKSKWPPLSEHQSSPLTLEVLVGLLQEVFKPKKKH